VIDAALDARARRSTLRTDFSEEIARSAGATGPPAIADQP
jgi:hypothetical protein